MRIFFVSVAVTLLLMGSTTAMAQTGMTDAQVIQYVQEGFDMFDKMINEIQYDAVKYCLRVNVKRVLVEQPGQPKKIDPNINPNLNRNGPCPCGSGKKFKHCCGKDLK